MTRSFTRTLVLIAFTLAASLCYAGTFAAYGPQVYVRGKGKPVKVDNTFSVHNPATTYTLHVESRRVDEDGDQDADEHDPRARARIWINGQEVVSFKDFRDHDKDRDQDRDGKKKKDDADVLIVIDKPVQLQSSNVLSVELFGKPKTSITVSVIGVDNDPPIITAVAAPAANAAGWNNSNVTITFTCSDMTSGVAVCPAPVLVSSEGAGQVISGTAKDLAGNSASISVTVSIDKTQPTIAAVLTPAANGFGWNNTDVAVNFNCADALSGIASCTSPITVSTEGSNQAVSGSATDNAGNTASTSASVSIDKTPPTITAQVTPAPNAAGWNKTPVTVSYTCSDALSGVAVCPSSANVSTEGANQNISNMATDKAGNQATSAINVSIDMTPPVVSITSPANGATVTTPTLSLTGTVSDALSGVTAVSCNGATATITNTSFSCPLSLVSGQNQITVLASDLAGNTTTAGETINFNPVPVTSIFLTPNEMNLVVGESRDIRLIGNSQIVLHGANWSTSDPTVLQISSADPPILTAVSPGPAMLTATYGGLSAQAQVTVYPGPDLPAGTVRWVAPPLTTRGGFSSFVQAVSTGNSSGAGGSITASLAGMATSAASTANAPTAPTMPDFYGVEREFSSSGLVSIVRAFTASGVQLWAHAVNGEAISTSAPMAATFASSAATFGKTEVTSTTALRPDLLNPGIARLENQFSLPVPPAMQALLKAQTEAEQMRSKLRVDTDISQTAVSTATIAPLSAFTQDLIL
ncbi:MAG TPA: Ig-like domain-containing protein, partial [Terriglobales bacterium]|nr:Ig-like domain-containing protein [Terriglobales bacterium]